MANNRQRPLLGAGSAITVADAGLDYRALSAAVRNRRAELAISQKAVHERGGPSDVVLGQIEAGSARNLRNDTLRKLDAGLGWVAGSAHRVLRGECATVRSTSSSGSPMSLALSRLLAIELISEPDRRQISEQIVEMDRLETVLGPLLDTPAGARQYVSQFDSGLAKVQGILNKYATT